MLLISRDSEHAAVVDEGAELELGKPDEEPARNRFGVHIGQGALSPPGLDTLRLGGLLDPLNRFFNPNPGGPVLERAPG